MASRSPLLGRPMWTIIANNVYTNARTRRGSPTRHPNVSAQSDPSHTYVEPFLLFLDLLPRLSYLPKLVMLGLEHKHTWVDKLALVARLSKEAQLPQLV